MTGTMSRDSSAPRSLQILGSVGSPYSRKMRSLVRYRRIPCLWVEGGGQAQRALSKLEAYGARLALVLYCVLTKPLHKDKLCISSSWWIPQRLLLILQRRVLMGVELLIKLLNTYCLQALKL